MDLQKLLRSVPITRRNTPFLFAGLLLLLGPAVTIYDIIFESHPIDLDLLLFALLMSGVGLVMGLIILLFFLPMQRQVKFALKKADYMYLCISKLDPDQQSVIESEASKFDTTWRSKTYLTSQIVTPPKFGKYCLYGKVVTRKTFGVNQHVILPYQNILEVVTEDPESGASKTFRYMNNALSAAGTVFSMVTSSGGVFTFVEKRPTIVVVDDAGNTYQIDCTDVDDFLEKLISSDAE